MFVLIVGMAMWVAMIGVSLWLQQIPGAVLVGFPAGLWVVLRGGNRTISRDAEPDREDPSS